MSYQIGIRYLWIDCFVFNSKNPKKTRPSIFPGYIQFSETHFARYRLRMRLRSTLAFSIPLTFILEATYCHYLYADSSIAKLSAQTERPYNKSEEPLNQRARTLVERYPLPRLLDYTTKHLAWKCWSKTYYFDIYNRIYFNSILLFWAKILLPS